MSFNSKLTHNNSYTIFKGQKSDNKKSKNLLKKSRVAKSTTKNHNNRFMSHESVNSYDNSNSISMMHAIDPYLDTNIYNNERLKQNPFEVRAQIEEYLPYGRQPSYAKKSTPFGAPVSNI